MRNAVLQSHVGLYGPRGGLPNPRTVAVMPEGRQPSALHAQAVRFLTTLRLKEGREDASKPLSLTDEQREFLRSKGMSDDAIEHARHDAVRPENLPPVDEFAAWQGEEQGIDALYDRAKQAFDEPPSSTAPPPLPPASYPASPLALYSTGHTPPRDANEVLSHYAESLMKPRYDVLISFFRVLHLILMLGGAASAIGVALYRRYMLPRLSQMIDARSSLFRLQLEQFEKLGELAIGLHSNRVDKLLPPNYQPMWIDKPAADPKSEPHAASETNATNLDVEKGKEGTFAAEAPTETPTEQPESQKASVPTQETKNDPEQEQQHDHEPEEDEEEVREPEKVLAPIDVTSSLRNALDNLQHTLRLAARAQSGERRAATASVSDEIEADEDGLIDLGAPESVSSHESDTNSPIPPVAPTRAMRALNGTMESFRNDLRARLLEEEDALTAISSRFSAYGVGQARASATPNPAAEMQQIKAEVRSLKGLMLSRYVFDAHPDATFPPTYAPRD